MWQTIFPPKRASVIDLTIVLFIILRGVLLVVDWWLVPQVGEPAAAGGDAEAQARGEALGRRALAARAPARRRRRALLAGRAAAPPRALARGLRTQ